MEANNSIPIELSHDLIKHTPAIVCVPNLEVNHPFGYHLLTAEI